MSDFAELPASAGARLRALMARLSASGETLGEAQDETQDETLGDSSLLAELGRVIGLADAIQLHGLLQQKQSAATDSAVTLGPGEAQNLAAELRDDVLHTRQTLLDTLADACGESGADGFLRWPNLDLAVGLDGLTPAQRLERFYSRLQQTLQVRVQELRQRTRRRLLPALPHLVELDTWLEQALVPHLERGLATIPRQLARHCAQALAVTEAVTEDADLSSSEPSNSEPSNSEPSHRELPTWQHDLRLMTCSLFIAETDVRLEPLLGLVEALEDNQRTD